VICGAAARIILMYPSYKGSVPIVSCLFRFVKGVMLYGSEDRAMEKPRCSRSRGDKALED
jgi:hypothetical protein